ncbi:bifunctional serine/threonine-protein kinase/formylglycine-generating enzyme family protein [Kamptonema animale CS-326]|jgi:formylglycine-generating enzyme required for sulfatase activity|uniref:bifunctional serine/threonine-protein kinase/formylglycine-generating enzyme family protein n=1 Tax=Kamptonema animale TaxID=92934 RepID=UPI00232BEBD1|nr:bifunctional serine/threonine-protein kinase/formylglycine-generating enzyme family protein [Kamptonema animale]MDB9512193.1 bifunctional serine/threonine-protein kinase/formylglycine-generating enzyme family protein [Kamptonema animale CS-326]
MLGQKLRDRYQIIKLLGSGGFGVTYLAKDCDLPGHPHCVVKHLKPKDLTPALLPIARRLFETEAEVLYKLGKLHERIPTLSAHFEENGEFYFVQDFIEGHDLTKELIPGNKLSESYVITLLQNILEILAFVHQQNVVHRDIKPANLMRRQDGKIVLIDFGVVKEIGTLIVNGQGQTSVTVSIGTPGYMPSEQSNGRPKLSSDIYAVGMVAIQALTGKTPDTLLEDPTTGEVIWRDRVQVIQNLANILDKMVRDHFSQRYQNATEALQALSLVPSTAISPHTTRRSLLQLGGFAGAGFVIAVVSQNLWNNSAQPSPSFSPSPVNDPPSPQPSPENSSPKQAPENPLSPPLSISLKTFNFEIVTVNSTGQIANRREGQAEFFTDNLGNGVTIDMISIPGGSFVMGSPNTEAGRYEIEGPQHNVTVAPFFMGKYEVTQEQWEAVMGNNPSKFKGAKLPVEQVSWYDAVAFCQKLSQKTGKSYRLPSEAEWEYACRAGTKTPFYFGATITPDLVNYHGSYTYGAAPKGVYREKTTDVGSFPPNAFGLYDMHGNVWEYCADPWHSDYQGAPQDGSVWDEKNNDNRYRDYDLLVNIKNDNRTRLVRGSSWITFPAYCRAAFRISLSPDLRNNPFGFRLVCAIA